MTNSSVALLTMQNLCSRIMSKFPLENINYCFAYGSSILKQLNNVNEKNMIDFIFSVNNAEEWHQRNLEINSTHYSALSHFGSKFIAKVQKNFPSKVYFNSMIPIKDENVVIKYGIIEENDLISDLLDWNYMYIAGRLQKPVKDVYKVNSAELESAMQLNLQSAVHAALLLLPENFTDIQFYKTITSLSYLGDFRMIVGEDKNKIQNIVYGALNEFRHLYNPVIKTLEEYIEIPEPSKFLYNGDIMCRQDISPSAKHFHLNHLPRTPQKKIVQFWNKGVRNRQDTEDVLRALAFDQDCSEVVRLILSNIVWDSSVQQSLKGIFTAGLWASVKYGSKKMGKMFNTKNQVI